MGRSKVVLLHIYNCIRVQRSDIVLIYLFFYFKKKSQKKARPAKTGPGCTSCCIEASKTFPDKFRNYIQYNGVCFSLRLTTQQHLPLSGPQSVAYFTHITGCCRHAECKNHAKSSQSRVLAAVLPPLFSTRGASSKSRRQLPTVVKPT